MKSLLRKRVAIPSEHGAWTWLLGPYVVGVVAAPHLRPDHVLLLGLCLAGFLLRQPIGLLVRIAVGRRKPDDRSAAVFWSLVYGVLALLLLSLLLIRGHAHLLWLAPPALLMFAYHLVLVSRRSERGSIPADILGSSTLALAAPAAYWVGGGTNNSTSFALWFWLTAHAAATIVHVFFLLKKRRQKHEDDHRKWKDALAGVAANGIVLIVVVFAASLGYAPALLVLGFGVSLVDVLSAVWRPPYGARVSAIGMRQLGTSALFYILMALAWR